MLREEEIKIIHPTTSPRFHAPPLLLSLFVSVVGVSSPPVPRTAVLDSGGPQRFFRGSWKMRIRKMRRRAASSRASLASGTCFFLHQRFSYSGFSFKLFFAKLFRCSLLLSVFLPLSSSLALSLFGVGTSSFPPQNYCAVSVRIFSLHFSLLRILVSHLSNSIL